MSPRAGWFRAGQFESSGGAFSAGRSDSAPADGGNANMNGLIETLYRGDAADRLAMTASEVIVYFFLCTTVIFDSTASGVKQKLRPPNDP